MLALGGAIALPPLSDILLNRITEYHCHLVSNLHGRWLQLTLGDRAALLQADRAALRH